MERKNNTNRRRFIALASAAILLLTSVTPAFAASTPIKMETLSGFKNYHNVRDWGVLPNADITKFSINGRDAFCIQSGRGVRDEDGNPYVPGSSGVTGDYTAEAVTEDDSDQSRIAYLGYYSKKAPSDKDYAFTQMMIWQTLPSSWQTANGKDSSGNFRSYFNDRSLREEYTRWKEEIQKKADSWDVYPSFCDGAQKIKAGQTVTVRDSRGVLEDYGAFSYSQDGISVSHVAGSNEMTVTAAKDTDKAEVKMSEKDLSAAGAVKHKSDVRANYIYHSDNSQDIAIYGSVKSPSMALSFSVELNGHLKIKKTSEDGIVEGVMFRVTGNGIDETVTTGKDGEITLSHISPGTYTVTEAGAPDRYADQKSREVTVKSGETATVTFDNILKKFTVELYKTDSETGRPLPDAEYRVYKDGELLGSYVTDENGRITTDMFICGEGYTLRELRPPAGYASDEKFYGIDGTEPGNFTLELNTIEMTVTDAPQKGKIVINKTGRALKSVMENSDGTYSPVFAPGRLSGAVFEIRAAEDIITADGTVRLKKGELADTVTSDEEGRAVSKSLYPGKYNIVETEAPYGHVSDDMIYQAEITAKEGADEAGTAVLDVENQRQKVLINFTKNIEEDRLFGIQADEYGDKVRFGLFSAEKITAADGSFIPKDGLIEITGLTAEKDGYRGSFLTEIPHGKYYVKEISSDDLYVTDGACYEADFEYGDSEDAVREISVNGGRPIENRLVRGNISGHKTDQNGRDLEGALMGLFSADAEIFSEENALLTDVSDSAGRFAFEDLPYGSYIVAEICQPEGFLLMEDRFNINITDDGEEVEITAVNEREPSISTYACFDDGSRSHLPDAKLTVKDRIKYENLYAGHPYVFKGRLLDRESGETVAVAESSFVPANSCGETQMVFTFDGSAYQETGGTFVAVQELYRTDRTGEQKVASHADMEDIDQTVTVTVPGPPETGDKTDAIFPPLLAAAMSSGCALLLHARRKKRMTLSQRNENIN